MKKEELKENWKSYFKKRGLSHELTESYMLYIDSMLNKKLPIIFEPEHLSELFGRSQFFTNGVVRSSDAYYRRFELKKRSGGTRPIDVPYPSLLECQYWIYKNILSNVKFSYCAHGFARKKSIVTNAKIHVGQNELLKLDLKDFFPSISKHRVIAMFHRLGYPPNVAHYLGSFCCLEDSLPQGAPTSPAISNIIAEMLDKRLFALAKKFDFRYTRYADDLAFSGESIPVKFIDYVRSIIEDEGFQVNNDKVRLYKGSGKRILTGVSISTGELKAPKSYKKKLFLELYYVKEYGLASHMAKKKIKIPYYLNSLIGKLHYVLSIEPNNEKAIYYLNHLKELQNSQSAIRISSDQPL